MSSFKDLRIVDNFYQTSAFFPMPTVCISTMNPDGSLNIGSYSLCFPYYIAGKDRYAMLLECRNTSNTCANLLRTHKCALNFIPDDRESFKEAVRLGFPGPSAEKMGDLAFEMEDGQADPADPDRLYSLNERARGRRQVPRGGHRRRPPRPLQRLQRDHLQVRRPLHPAH